MFNIFRFRLKFYLLSLLISNAFAQTKNETYLFSQDIASKIKNDTVAWKYQTGATEYSFGGYYKKALQTWDSIGVVKPKWTKKDSTYFQCFRPLMAKDYIVERSKNEKIIIINEAHHNASHRVFTLELLQELYNNGYSYLGLEAIADTEINQRKFVTNKSGYYTNEPQMANLINEAIKIGYTIVNYEASEDKNGKEREMEQAQNIAKIITQNPKAKILIHCGWDHVIEGPPNNSNWEKAMAGWLKEMTQINPFTIDQTTYTEKGSAEYNKPQLQLVKENSPVIMVNEKGETYNGGIHNNQVDCRIIHPETKFINDRPNWLRRANGRKEYQVPKSKLTEFPLLVLAYHKGEYEQGGIPYDNIEIKDKNEEVPLLLQKGEYTIIIKTEDYKVFKSYELTQE